MKTNKEKIFDYIVDYSKEFKTLEDDTPKFDTRFLSEKLNMQRTNISSVLNQLVEEGKLSKTNGRPVMFYLSDEQNTELDNLSFSNIIGSDLSLKETLQLTKAAITYPIRIPHVLYIGEKGVGVKTISEKVFDFACSQRILKKNSAFKVIDCLHFDKNQMNERSFWQKNFESIKDGLLLVKNADKISINMFTDISNMLIEKKELKFILIVHVKNADSISIFKDYFNFIVNIPPLEKRTLEERYQFIEKFFKEEALKLEKNIEVNYGLMQCLMLYPCIDNLIELKSNIRFGVANALVRFKRNKTIVLELSDLPASVRKGLLLIRDKIHEIDQVLEKNVNYIFTKEQTLQSRSKKNDTDIYQKIDFDYKALGQITVLKDAEEFVFANIEHNLNEYLNKITENRDVEKIKTIVSEKLYQITNEFIQTASIKFNRVYSNKAFLGICLHFNNAIISNRTKQRISNEKVMSIIEQYDEEYLYSRKFIKKLQDEFNVKFSLDESVLLTLLIANDKNQISKNREVITLIIMHGDNTATSISKVVKKLMPINNLQAFDLSLDDDIETSYELLKKKIIDVNQGSGILALYDMGSIQVMLNSIKDETGIDIKSIEVPIPLLAISACKSSEEGKSLEDIYQHLANEYSGFAYSRMQSKDIVIVLSSVHENNSDSIKRYLQTLEDYRDYQILAFNITDKQNLIDKINEVQIKGNVVGIVGTYNPDIFNLKYVDYSHLPNVHTIHELFAETKDDFDVLDYLVEQFDIFKKDELNQTLIPFIESLQKIFHMSFSENTRLGLLIHMGCLIDRLQKKYASSVNFNINTIKEKYSKEYGLVSQSLYPLEEGYNVKLSDGDKATIIEIIINSKKEK